NRLEPVFSESLYAVLSKIVYAIELYNLDTLVRPAAALREQQNNFLLNLAEGQPSKRDHFYTLNEFEDLYLQIAHGDNYCQHHSFRFLDKENLQRFSLP